MLPFNGISFIILMTFASPVIYSRAAKASRSASGSRSSCNSITDYPPWGGGSYYICSSYKTIAKAHVLCQKFPPNLLLGLGWGTIVERGALK